MMWNLFERRVVTSFKDGAIYKTKVVGYKWFKAGQAPEIYTLDENNEMWCHTSTEPKFQKDEPDPVSYK